MCIGGRCAGGVECGGKDIKGVSGAAWVCRGCRGSHFGLKGGIGCCVEQDRGEEMGHGKRGLCIGRCGKGGVKCCVKGVHNL